MFARRYFPARYFAPRYFPQSQGAVASEPAPDLVFLLPERNLNATAGTRNLNATAPQRNLNFTLPRRAR